MPPVDNGWAAHPIAMNVLMAGYWFVELYPTQYAAIPGKVQESAVLFSVAP
jgi:hypothetical protein